MELSDLNKDLYQGAEYDIDVCQVTIKDMNKEENFVSFNYI